ncbi:MAG: peptidoglycan DD-metalloendopeptidase family protein, partial [Cyanobacteria bacterium J06554_11]
MSDSSHSCIQDVNEQTASTGNRVKSATMLGIALSVGASGALVSPAEASAAVSVPTTSETTKAFSSESKVSAVQGAGVAAASPQEIVAYHTVASGESLWQIAQQHRVGLQDLKSANELPPETSIRVGQVLRVPAGNTVVALASTNLPAEAVVAGGELVEQIETEAADSVESNSVESNSQPVLVAEAPDEPVASIEIEIADASQIETEPVVTAYAAPPEFSNYQIQAGDTLASIASSMGTTTQDIIVANGLTNPDIILTGSILRVPSMAASGQPIGGAEPVVVQESSIGTTSGQRLAYLQSTAARPHAARLLDGIRRAETPAAEQELVAAAESVDPYVVNLLEEVEEIRETSVQVSEVSADEMASATEGSSLLDRAAERGFARREAAEVAIAPDTSTPEANSELLAAAPLSPDAYLPAQGPSQAQVVSPDMPILPEANEFLPEAPEYFDGYVWPTRGTVTSGYGYRWGRMHRGVDVAGPVGTPVVAAGMGVVEQAGWNSGGYGNLVEIRHPDGSLTRYAHNNRLNVSTGQTVRQGQQIAEMGSTGYSTGPHLHFEIHIS